MIREAVVVRRTYAAADLDIIANDPGVIGSIGAPGGKSVTLAPLIGIPENVALVVNGGAALFAFCEPRLYEVHVMFLPSARGRYAVRASEAMLDWMFSRTDCEHVLGPVPMSNFLARALAFRVGMKPGERVDVPLAGSPFLMFNLSKKDWK